MKHTYHFFIKKLLKTKKKYTTIKKPKISSMTHEDEEEMQHDISKLRYPVQQISLSQRVTKNELEAMMNV